MLANAQAIVDAAQAQKDKNNTFYGIVKNDWLG